MKRFLMAAIVGVTAVSAAHAGDHKGWSFGAAAVFADFEDDGKLIDDNAVGFKLIAGYRFNRYLGVEGAYVNTSDFDGTTTPGMAGGDKLELSFKGFTGHFVGFIPIPSEDVQPFVKVGFFDFDRDLTINGIGGSNGHDDGLAVGAGTLIRISDELDVRAEVDWYDANDSDLWSVNLGLQYRFGRSK